MLYFHRIPVMMLTYDGSLIEMLDLAVLRYKRGGTLPTKPFTLYPIRYKATVNNMKRY